MPLLLYLSLLASAEVRQDQYLDDISKQDLINYFATKVEEECDELRRK